MHPRHALPFLLLAAGILAQSCGPVSNSEPVPPCNEVGARLTQICASPAFGEDVRVDCQVFGLDPKIRRCLMRVTDCSFDAINQGCGLVDVMVTCTTTADCPTPLLCAPSTGTCGECVTAADCATGMTCTSGGGACFVRPGQDAGAGG